MVVVVGQGAAVGVVVVDGGAVRLAQSVELNPSWTVSPVSMELPSSRSFSIPLSRSSLNESGQEVLR